MGRPTLLTPEKQRSIVAAVRAGAFDWVAAEANGVDRETFKLWMRIGTRTKKEPYLSFVREVRSARAQARLSAEIEVRKDQPFSWLRFGPGRERDGEAGWTESTEVRHSGTFTVAESPEWLRVAAALDLALEPYPEARLAVASALRALQAAEADTSPAPELEAAVGERGADVPGPGTDGDVDEEPGAQGDLIAEEELG